METLHQLIVIAKENKALLILAGSSCVHVYQIVVQAGGLKKIWNSFINGPAPKA